MKVSFSGIYDIRFPVGTKSEDIDNKAEEARKFLKENLPLPFSVDVSTLDCFSVTKSDKKLEDKGIRISSSIDNPWFLCRLFDHLNKQLGQDYVNQSKVELILDTKA